MEEWQKEFGKNTYYLADSFNEMELPVNTDEPENPRSNAQRVGRTGVPFHFLR